MTVTAEALGPRLAQLSPVVKKFHTSTGSFEGQITVEPSPWLPLKMVAHLAGLPRAAQDAPLRVEKTADGDAREQWTRIIGDRPFSSVLWCELDGLAERMGPITAVTDTEAVDGGIEHVLLRSKALGIPVPSFLAPGVKAREWEEDGLYRFEIEISAPLGLGRLVRYFGFLRV